jgi:hypothetical protein
MVAVRPTAWSMRNTAQALSSASVVPFPSAVEPSASTTGKKSAVPAGTVQWRSAMATELVAPVGLAEKLPPRNQTGPDWPALQSAESGDP